MLNCLDNFFYSPFRVVLCSLGSMSNFIVVHYDMSLKDFLQTLKHSKQSHKCVLHDHKELLETFFSP